MAVNHTSHSDKASESFRAVGFITSWNFEYNTTLDPKKLTHINFAFGFVFPDGSIRDINDEQLKEVIGYKKRNPNLKVLLSLQQTKQTDFSLIASSPELTELIAGHCRSLIAKYNLDGIDIDWEYPGTNIITGESYPQDKLNYSRFLASIRKAIGEGKLLTIACGALEEYLAFTDWKVINSYVDFYNIMTYDFNWNHWDQNHQSNLYPPSIGNSYMCGDLSVRLLEERGVPKEKMNLGLPFYGYAGDPDSGMTYPTLQKIISDLGIPAFDEAAQQSYIKAPDGSIAVVYDDPMTIKVKACYVAEKGLGGLMCWELGQDNLSRELTNAMWEALTKAFDKKSKETASRE
jgi:chitinase